MIKYYRALYSFDFIIVSAGFLFLLRTLSRVTKEPEAREHHSTGSLVAGQDHSKRTPVTKRVGTGRAAIT